MAAKVVPLDPYDPVIGLLVPFVTQRMLDFAREYAHEVDPVTLVQDYMVRLYQRDPNVMILVVVNEKGNPVGHCAASIQTDGKNRWVFVSQLRLDENVGDARGEGLEMLDAWGRAAGCTKMLMATSRNEKPWERRFGFRTSRRVCERELGARGEE